MAAAAKDANILWGGERLRAGPPYLQAKWQENAVSSLHDFNIPSSERVILTARETMGRNDPLKLIFLFALATAPLAILKVEPALRENYVPLTACSVLAMLLLLSWWLDCLGHRLVVTDRRTIFRKGLLSKFTNEILHSHVRNIQINQSVFQRLMHVGSIGISSSGQSGIEIFIRGIPNPYEVKRIIDQYRFGETTLSSDANDHAEQYQHPVA
jgi:Bacterial PH domain